MRKQLLMMVAASAIFAACNKDDDAKPNNNGNNNNNSTTIKAGTKFTYKHTKFDNQTGTTVITTGQYTLTMLRDTTINNEKWLVVERKDETQSAYGLVKFAADGMYRYGSNGAGLDMKFKCAANDTWTDPENQSCKVISINQSVTVPKGTFSDAYYVEKSDANSLENKQWYNEKEFMLKAEEYDESPSTPGTMIIDYRDELVELTY